MTFFCAQVNGSLTFPDNIADIIGVDAAYLTRMRTRKKREPKLPGLARFTPEQIFFLNAAQLFCSKLSEEDAQTTLRDTHTDGTERHNGVYRNSRKFSQAFNCKPGSRMNPTVKCKLWKMDGY